MPRAPQAKLASGPKPTPAKSLGLTIRKYGATGRAYFLDGEKLISVSMVKKVTDKPGLVKWAARVEREAVIAASVEEMREVRASIEKAVGLGAKDLLAMLPSDQLWQALVEARVGPVQAQLKAMQEAANIGTNVHAVCEWQFKSMLHKEGLLTDPGPCPEITSEGGARSVARFREWLKDADVHPLGSEISTCSPTHKYGGTLDQLAYVAGRVAILDWKTGGDLYLEDHLQISAYFHAYNEFTPSQVRGVTKADVAYLVHLPKVEGDGEARVRAIERAELEHHFWLFKQLIPVAHRLAEWDAARGYHRN